MEPSNFLFHTFTAQLEKHLGKSVVLQNAGTFYLLFEDDFLVQTSHQPHTGCIKLNAFIEDCKNMGEDGKHELYRFLLNLNHVLFNKHRSSFFLNDDLLLTLSAWLELAKTEIDHYMEKLAMLLDQAKLTRTLIRSIYFN